MTQVTWNTCTSLLSIFQFDYSKAWYVFMKLLWFYFCFHFHFVKERKWRDLLILFWSHTANNSLSCSICFWSHIIRKTRHCDNLLSDDNRPQTPNVLSLTILKIQMKVFTKTTHVWLVGPFINLIRFLNFNFKMWICPSTQNIHHNYRFVKIC